MDSGQRLSRQTGDATTVGTQTNRREATGLVDPLPGVPNSDPPGAGWEGLESKGLRTSVTIVGWILQEMDRPDRDQSLASSASRRGDIVVPRLLTRLHISRREVRTGFPRQIAKSPLVPAVLAIRSRDGPPSWWCEPPSRKEPVHPSRWFD